MVTVTGRRSLPSGLMTAVMSAGTATRRRGISSILARGCFAPPVRHVHSRVTAEPLNLVAMSEAAPAAEAPAEAAPPAEEVTSPARRPPTSGQPTAQDGQLNKVDATATPTVSAHGSGRIGCSKPCVLQAKPLISSGQRKGRTGGRPSKSSVRVASKCLFQAMPLWP